jgi:hypothetical protein
MAVAAVIAVTPSAARAFCGFYVDGAGSEMFNNATMVVMMRDGTRTVLSMQNNYEGPPSDFAMVVPVPVVLQKENVKTLPSEVFDRVDKLAAPRLVEYWEQDPCMVAPPMEEMAVMKSGAARPAAPRGGAADDLGVKIEAQFKVGEYEVVILSARDSTGLDKWLAQEGYKIPDGSEPLLRPYVEAGSKFFVAKVDVEQVKFVDGRAKLSPLRFHYDTEKFQLPVRLGLVNSGGTQDLIVHILAKGKRYEVANYPNVTIPTNIDVDDSARDEFASFYTALFDSTLEKNKGAVITEYSWDASSCDPCPTPALDGSELATLGGDVIPDGQDAWGFVLTRLHARYGKDSLGEDLVFSEAKPIAGGREWRTGEKGQLEKGAVDASRNMFQARYAIRYPWTGKIECDNPVRGRWGGPPGDYKGPTGTRPATDLAFAPRGKIELAKVVREDIPEIGLISRAPAPVAIEAKSATAGGGATAEKKKKGGGCGCEISRERPGGARALLGLAFAMAVVLRRRAGSE